MSPWGLDPVDRPERLRRYTRIRRQIGERRYRHLRLDMSVSQSHRQLSRMRRELARLRSAISETDR